jgi:hypothetical protein
MIYRVLDIHTINSIIDWCEKRDVDYDIWNAEDMFSDGPTDIEIGMSKKDWENWQKEN